MAPRQGKAPSSSMGVKSSGGGMIQLSELALRTNNNVLEYSRTFQAAASGCAAGILGLTSLYGFAFYFICVIVQAILWWLKAGGDWGKFFLTKSNMVGHSVLGGLFTYILFWTFLYGMVHVY